MKECLLPPRIHKPNLIFSFPEGMVIFQGHSRCRSTNGIPLPSVTFHQTGTPFSLPLQFPSCYWRDDRLAVRLRSFTRLLSSLFSSSCPFPCSAFSKANLDSAFPRTVPKPLLLSRLPEAFHPVPCSILGSPRTCKTTHFFFLETLSFFGTWDVPVSQCAFYSLTPPL